MKKKLLKNIFSTSGVTLLELVTVMIMAAILIWVGTRTIGGEVDRERATQTIEELEALEKALIGDPSVVENGDRVDFGYFGDFAGWPRVDSKANFTADIGPYLEIGSGTSGDLAEDAWENDYILTSDANFFRIVSRGADNAAGGTDVDTDISLVIRKDQWQNNSVAIYIQDAAGTLLIPALAGADADSGHISQVILTENGGATYTWSSGGGANTLARSNNAYQLLNTTFAGSCSVTVRIAGGSGGGPPYEGIHNWRPDLSNGDITYSQSFVVYPKGGFGIFNALIVKLPGSANIGFNEK